MTPAQAWRRAGRALHEITGIIDPVQLQRRLYDMLEPILGPCVGMSKRERWERMTDNEREVFVEALEERSAMIHDGKKEYGK